MTNKEVDTLLQSLIRLSKEDTPGQNHAAIEKLGFVDGGDLLATMIGISALALQKGKTMTIKQALEDLNL
jgi:hypothetical protein